MKAGRSPLLESVRAAIRLRHYSIRTEQAYVGWIVRYIHFHHVTHPSELGPDAVTAFLTYLAVERNVAPSTQNQALNALNFLYAYVLNRPLGELVNGGAKLVHPGGAKLVHLTLCGTQRGRFLWTHRVNLEFGGQAGVFGDFRRFLLWLRR